MKPISRRDMLGKASLVGVTVAVGLPLAEAAAEPLPGTTSPSTKPKLKVIVAGGHRNAHPDWITHPGGSFSKSEWRQSLADLTFLNRFYGYKPPELTEHVREVPRAVAALIAAFVQHHTGIVGGHAER